MQTPVDQAEDVGELVDHVLRDFEEEALTGANALYWGDDDRQLAGGSNWELLDGLCELLGVDSGDSWCRLMSAKLC